MVTFRGRLKPDDPLYRTGFLIFHQNPYSPGLGKLGNNLPTKPKARPKAKGRAKGKRKPQK